LGARVVAGEMSFSFRQRIDIGGAVRQAGIPARNERPELALGAGKQAEAARRTDAKRQGGFPGRHWCFQGSVFAFGGSSTPGM